MIVVEEKQIQSIIELIKSLPVSCDGRFEVADTWVATVVSLENLLRSPVKIGEEEKKEGEEDEVDG